MDRKDALSQKELEIPGRDDEALVVSSVESEDYHNLGPTMHYHLDPPRKNMFTDLIPIII
jgi:hypothetical protein